jgi:hypothetical protein
MSQLVKRHSATARKNCKFAGHPAPAQTIDPLMSEPPVTEKSVAPSPVVLPAVIAHVPASLTSSRKATVTVSLAANAT